MTDPDFDVVIIGSGVAGALAAFRLAPRGIKVLILEAGDEPPQDHARFDLRQRFVQSWSKGQTSPYVPYVAPQPNALDAPNLAPTLRDGRDYYVEQDPPNGDRGKLFVSYYQALVGGALWHWQGIAVRMVPTDFRMKAQYGRGDNWPISYDELEPWYSAAEHEMGVAGSPEMDQLLGVARSRDFPMPEITPTYVDHRFRTAVHDQMFGHVRLKVTSTPQARNSRPFDGRPACDGQGTCVPLCPTLAKYEALFHLRKALAAGAALWPRSVVTRLELNADGQVAKAWYKRWDRSGFVDQTEQFVTARLFVLAANGIESPKLLLLSATPKLPKGVANSSGLVGKRLMDHPIKVSYALAQKPVFPFRGPPSTSAIETFRDGSFRAEYGAFRTSIRNDGWSFVAAAPRGRDLTSTPARQDANFEGTLLQFVGIEGLFGKALKRRVRAHTTRQVLIYSAVEMLPNEANCVYPSTRGVDRDRLGIPRPVIEFNIGDYARDAFKAVASLHAFVFEKLGVSRTPRIHYNVTNAVDQDFGSGHVIGTTVMGAEQRASVVDSDCRSHDCHNLFILGSSVFPTASAANPTLTIAALSLRAADTIRRQLIVGARRE
jgi:choline dehydrogenase-like flavoprotein